jgi:hypothetical protein
METLGPWWLASSGDAEGATALARLLPALRERGRRVERVGGSITLWELPEPPRSGGRP